ncbi:ABC transporter ATP-binding protein [Paenactinomyces guangxiensis]|uniref:ABC transporter ATP-binding protein n=1 Tax=Paenactinomyces guangxiensis TaxID=1490290 RepID=A0A7W2AAB3_9BACL|nr:ABC transporter ATP-binding protein [Paenactinomyces guangxiensis]MBA4496097.1 ABC transporter ATP-binding protein [Paenactinomyces guangxiensis]MBH8593184.1 ABC transporter ATP-binding protein [Paenactinomyces guangxiensis]
MSAILQFDKVSYAYDQGRASATILKSVDFAFARGKFYTILGPSGSGKTTTLSLAAALDSPRSGRILYEGQDIKQLGLERYRNEKVAIVFQNYNLLPYMSALQNVVTAMEIRKTTVANKKVKALELLERVGLTKEEAERNVLRLSGGQQQRVAIARALSCNVDLILADEPTGNLDEETALEIINIFKELAHQENKCIITVTHSNEIANQSDTAIWLRKKTFVVA